MATVEQPTSAPTNKVAAAGIGGALTSILVWIVSVTTKVEVPPEVAAAGATVVAFILGYLVPERA